MKSFSSLKSFFLVYHTTTTLIYHMRVYKIKYQTFEKNNMPTAKLFIKIHL